MMRECIRVNIAKAVIVVPRCVVPRVCGSRALKAYAIGLKFSHVVSVYSSKRQVRPY
jgi:hypothetical protein